MPAHPENKYHLRDLHKEIDFFDRKIAHCNLHEKFDSEEARVSALHKLEVKRGSLVKAAIDLVGKGIEYDAKDLPRSLQHSASAANTEAPASTQATTHQG